ncbi:MAG TPA: hypothetical protein VHR66_09660 [Gemmataceae bacterium]|nr:hypothetical protein [Gemmataceae bacterium]
MSDSLRGHIGDLIRRATAHGIGVEFRNAVVDILFALRDDPREAGDPLRKLRGMNSILYRVSRNSLIGYYTIHERIPMVTVWQFEPSPQHPLAPPSANGA